MQPRLLQRCQRRLLLAVELVSRTLGVQAAQHRVSGNADGAFTVQVTKSSIAFFALPVSERKRIPNTPAITTTPLARAAGKSVDANLLQGADARVR